MGISKTDNLRKVFLYLLIKLKVAMMKFKNEKIRIFYLNIRFIENALIFVI